MECTLDQHLIMRRMLHFSQHLQLEKDEHNHEKSTSLNTDKEPKPVRTYSKTKFIGLLLGPVLFLVTLFLFHPPELSFEGRATLAITLWVATWWITEAIPIPASALLPVILFPLFGALEADGVVSSYGNDIIFLFLGGFLIAAAMEKWNLHLRIALTIINFVGASPNRLVLGFMIATGFLSLWISNTAAAMLMIPIGLAIITQATESFKHHNQPLDDLKKFEKSIVFGIGYAATIAGSGTLISGTANPIMAGQASQMFGIDITFGQIMAIGIPFVTVFIVLAWGYITKIKYRTSLHYLPGGSDIIKSEKKKLGRMNFEEKIVLFVFLTVAFLWITRTFIWESVFIQITDGMIAMVAVLLLFAIPASSLQERILEWKDTAKIPWGILVLFGGGLAIAAAFQNTGLAKWIGIQFTLLEGTHFLVIIIVLTLSVLLLTEITSTTATATLLMPIVGSLGLALGVNPVVLMVACAFATNASFMLPVATPPNAIMFGTGKITSLDMIKVGGVLNIISAILIVSVVTLLVPLIWGMDLLSL